MPEYLAVYLFHNELEQQGGAMKIARTMTTMPILALLALGAVARAQQSAPPPAQAAPAAKPAMKKSMKAAASPEDMNQKQNINEYINLLRSDVRQQKAEIMGAVMGLSAEDAAKFWPIYSEYDASLSKLNDTRLANIKEYAQEYNGMTDEQADALMRKAADFQRQRNELLAQYYGQMKDALGAVTAARFVQVEHQLLLIIDLQIDSALPLIGQNQ